MNVNSSLLDAQRQWLSDARRERDAALARIGELEAEVAARDARIAKFEAWARADEIARSYCRTGKSSNNWNDLIRAVTELDRLRDEATGRGGDGG